MAKPPAPQVREFMVAEPVFQGQAYILEAGWENETTVILVHGLGDMAARTWETLIPELARHYRVLALDLPGFGRSEKKNALYSPARYASFLKWIVDRHVDGPFVLAGHSLGGAIALKYAATYPKDLQQLILIDVAGVLHRRVLTREILEPNLKGTFPDIPIALGRIDEWVGGLIERLPDPPLDMDRILESKPLRAKVLGGDPARIAAMALAQEDFSAALGKIQAPTVILWGENDVVTPLRTGFLLETNLRSARLQVIPQAAHVPMHDQPYLFNRAFLDALADPAPRAVSPPAIVKGRIGRCQDESGVFFTGGYERLEITDCTDVRLRNVTAGSISLTRSRATMEKVQIRSSGTAMRAVDSVITATGMRVEGDTALLVENSRLDLAGSTFIGESAAITTTSRARLLFSVSRIHSPHSSNFMHGYREITALDPL